MSQKKEPIMISTNTVLKLIKNITKDELNELSKKQHDKNGKRTLQPMLYATKRGKFRYYSENQLIAIFIYKSASNGVYSKDLLRRLLECDLEKKYLLRFIIDGEFSKTIIDVQKLENI